MFNRNPKEFLRRFVTVDETWIHYCTPEMISPGERAPKKAKTVPSSGKVMATVFWDSKGIIINIINRLFGKGKNNNGTVLC